MLLQWDDRVMESWSQFTISILSPANSCCSYYCQSVSVRLSNRVAYSSVQVLVTVVYLCFSKLVLAVINVFTSADVYIENTSYKVWYWDGSVEYGVGSHLILMIITLLVVIPLLLPYILLLLFVRPI